MVDKFSIQPLTVLLFLSLSGFLWIKAVTAQANQTDRQAAPITRNRLAMVYDTARKQTIIFGGAAKTKSAPDIWEWQVDTWGWDGRQWSKLNIAGPSGRTRFGMSYDARRAKVLLFGGTASNGIDGATWEYDGQRWQQVSSTGPSARARFGMTSA